MCFVSNSINFKKRNCQGQYANSNILCQPELWMIWICTVDSTSTAGNQPRYHNQTYSAGICSLNSEQCCYSKVHILSIKGNFQYLLSWLERLSIELGIHTYTYHLNVLRPLERRNCGCYAKQINLEGIVFDSNGKMPMQVQLKQYRWLTHHHASEFSRCFLCCTLKFFKGNQYVGE